ncbi:MAG: acyltransferase [Clostridia bacterium]|nr:acyltransferase [Clostridia bacterium]
MKFTKEDTLAIKGIAILLMVQHHNFGVENMASAYNISCYPFSPEFMLSKFCKICVGIYVFLSAYGLTLSLKKYSSDTVISGRQYSLYMKTRLIKLMWGYWFIFIAAQIACAIIAQSQMKVYFSKGIYQGIYQFFLDFCGFANLFGTGTLNGTWWYMSLAIFIVILVPFVAKLNKKYTVLLPAFLCIFIPRMVQSGLDFNIGRTNNIFRWMLVVVIGVAFAQYDVLARMKSFMITKNKYISKIIKFVILTAVLVFLYLARSVCCKGSLANYTYEFNDNILPVYVIYYCYEFITDIPVLRQILVFLGKHSMNIFLMHTFIRHHFLQDFVYSFKHFMLVNLVVIVLSILISIALELLKKAIKYNKLMDVIIQKITLNEQKRCEADA